MKRCLDGNEVYGRYEVHRGSVGVKPDCEIGLIFKPPGVLEESKLLSDLVDCFEFFHDTNNNVKTIGLYV